jgi:DNA polymerase-3 subunit beta
MELVFSRRDMTKAMGIVSRTAGRSSGLPVLASVLISAARDPLWDILGATGDENESIYLAATDLEVGIRTSIPGGVIENGGIALPAKEFASVISALSQDDVELTTSGDKAMISCGKGEFRMSGIPAEEFPSLMGKLNREEQPELIGQPEDRKDIQFLSIEPGVLGTMLRRTSYAASRDERRPILNGVYLSMRNNGSQGSEMQVQMAATDGVRLAVASAAIEGTPGKDTGVIISSRSVSQLEKLMDRSDAVKVGFQGNRMLFCMGGTVLVSALLEGEYPDYSRVIPAESRICLKVDTSHLLSALRRMVQVADAKLPCVRLEAKGSRLKVSASSAQVGEGNEEMDVEKDGDDIQITLNARYLMEALNAIDSQETLLWIDSEIKPIVVKPASGEYLCVLMPVRV